MKVQFALLILSFTFFSCHNDEKVKNEIKLDFDEKIMGFKNPDELARSFFQTLQTDPKSLSKHFANQNVWGYVVNNAGPKNKQEAIDALNTKWDILEKEQILNCKILEDSIKENGIEISQSEIDSIKYKIEDIPSWGGKMKGCTVVIFFSFNNSQHYISLHDCGSVKEKWFLMSANVQWVGSKLEAIMTN